MTTIRDVRERTIPLASNMRNAYVDFSAMTATLVAVESDAVVDGRNVTGYGFSSPGRYAQGGILRERVIPRLKAATPQSLVDPVTGVIDPVRAHAVMMAAEKPGGHGDRSVAVGAVDMALWDLAAKLLGVPLAQLFSERYGKGQPADQVWVYAAGGYYTDGASPQSLVDELKSYRDRGFVEVKMKIGGATLEEDRKRVEAAVDALGAGSELAVDANGKFGLEAALQYGEMLEPFGLLWYEEPGDPLDFELNRAVVESQPGPVATGENLFSHQDTRNLLRYGGMRSDRDYLQMDPALSYGPTEFIRMVQVAEELGWSRERFVPHGGHQLNLALAAGLGLGGTECYPGVFAPIGGFADSTPVVASQVAMPELPGIGVEGKADLWAALQQV